MKKPIYFSLVVVLFFNIGCSNIDIKTDKENLNIKGNVESILTLSYEAIDKFGQGEYVKSKLNLFDNSLIDFDSIGNIVSNIEYIINKNSLNYEEVYNDKGLTSKTTSYVNGEIEDVNEYKYDQKGNIISEAGKSENGYKREFNNLGQIIKEVGQFDINIYKYDTKGNVIEILRYYWPYGSPTISKLMYDSLNRIIRDDVVGNHYWSYSYNAKGQNTEVNMYSLKESDKGKLLKKTKLTYDQNNNIFMRKIWNKDGEIESICKIYYMLDDTLPIMQIELNKDNLITAIYDNSYRPNNKILETKSFLIESEILFEINSIYKHNNIISKSFKSDSIYRNDIYIYDDNKLLRSESSDDEGKTITRYDKLNRRESITKYDKNKKIIEKTAFKYSGNESKGTIESTYFNTKNKTESVSIQKITDGRVIENICKENGLDEVLTFDYDANDNIIKMTNSINSNITKYLYKYDKFGNWVKQTIIENNKPKEIKIRAIKYYL